MRDEERRYDEASQLCRAAEDLSERVESLRHRLRDRRTGDGGGPGQDLERAEEAAREALKHLRCYREKLIGGSPREVGDVAREVRSGIEDTGGAAEEVGAG